jgi:hypothetical protein
MADQTEQAFSSIIQAIVAGQNTASARQQRRAEMADEERVRQSSSPGYQEAVQREQERQLGLKCDQMVLGVTKEFLQKLTTPGALDKVKFALMYASSLGLNPTNPVNPVRLLAGSRIAAQLAEDYPEVNRGVIHRRVMPLEVARGARQDLMERGVLDGATVTDNAWHDHLIKAMENIEERVQGYAESQGNRGQITG